MLSSFQSAILAVGEGGGGVKPGRPVKRWRDGIVGFIIMNKLFYRVTLDRRECERVRSTIAYFGPGVHHQTNSASIIEI